MEEETVMFTVKRTFIEFPCFDEDVAKMQRRRKSEPCVPSLEFLISTKCMEAPTPTTCPSLNGDDHDSSTPSSPYFPEDCDASDHGCSSSFSGAFDTGMPGLPATTPSPPACFAENFQAPPLQPVPFTTVRDASVNFQGMMVSPESLAPAMQCFSTCPAAMPEEAAGCNRGAGARQQRDTATLSEVGKNVTLMVRNLAQDMTQAQFSEHLIAGGYRGLFDFMYMPMNLRAEGNFGYAFVNFKSHTIAMQVMARLQNRESGDAFSSLEWSAMWSTCQGFDANVERYRNSPLMHALVPMYAKPSVYDSDGKLSEFPKPTKTIAKPRIHRTSPKNSTTVS